MSFSTHTFQTNPHGGHLGYAFHEDMNEGQKIYFLAKFQEGTKENLIPTLEQCWATVTYTSGMGIDSYINGVPSFTMDTGNFAYCLGNTNLKYIESPDLPDREQWLSNLCYAQWCEYEMQEGKVWNHIKEIL